MIAKFLALFYICINNASLLEVNYITQRYVYETEDTTKEVFKTARAAVEYMGLGEGLECHGFNKITYNSTQVFFGPLTITITHIPYTQSSTMEFFELITKQRYFTLAKFIDFMDNGLGVSLRKLSSEVSEVILRPSDTGILQQLANSCSIIGPRRSSFLYRYAVNFEREMPEFTQIYCDIGLQINSYHDDIVLELTNAICTLNYHLVLTINNEIKNKLFTNWLKSRSEAISIQDFSIEFTELFQDCEISINEFDTPRHSCPTPQIEIISDSFRIVLSPLFHKHDEIYKEINDHHHDRIDSDSIFRILKTITESALALHKRCRFLSDVKFFIEQDGVN